MNNEDQKLKNFLDKHDAGSKFEAHPNEWARISQKIENQTNWWLKKPTLMAMSTAVVLAIILAFNIQSPLQQQPVTAVSDEEAVTYLIEAYSIVDNGFETPEDDYYSLL